MIPSSFGSPPVDPYVPRPLAVRQTFERHPVGSAVALSVGFVALSAAVGAVAPLVLPGVRPDFVALCALSVAVAALLGWLGWWREAGFTGPAAWRRLRLLWFPVALTVALPFVAGVAPLASATLGFLAVAYLLTGFMEEAFSRGIVLRVLRPTGAVSAVLVSAALFGLLHLGNLLYRPPGLVLSQVVGATCFGVGYAALRLRTGTLWPLLLLHAASDLTLHLTRLPAIPLEVVRDVLLLGYGLWLLRAARGSEPAPAIRAPKGEAR